MPDIDIVAVGADAYPVGTAEAAADALRTLAARGVLAVIGPAISDNALACMPVADELQVPCINWSGSEATRSDWMFQYQVGSLEDEPVVMAEHLNRCGWRRVAVVREDSIIGRRYAHFFTDAALTHDVEVITVIDIDHDGATADAVVLTIEQAAPDAVVFFGQASTTRLAAALEKAVVPIIANAALLAGHSDPTAASLFEGWCYVDVCDDDNPVLQRLRAA